jgi:hypothetical protein
MSHTERITQARDVLQHVFRTVPMSESQAFGLLAASGVLSELLDDHR